jgi:hypothetical protein
MRLLQADHVGGRETKNTCRVLVTKSLEKRQLGRPRRRLEDNMRKDLKDRERCCEDGWWMELYQVRVPSLNLI